VPIRIGAPQDCYPWGWSITPWFEGATADLEVSAPERPAVVAAFLRALHVPAPEDAPRILYRGVPLAERAPVSAQRLAYLAGRNIVVDERVRRIWADGLGAPVDTEPTWIHGDLHPRNVLARAGRIVAIIDWGDITRGDRATDLAAVWLLLADATARRHAIAVLGSLPASGMAPRARLGRAPRHGPARRGPRGRSLDGGDRARDAGAPGRRFPGLGLDFRQARSIGWARVDTTSAPARTMDMERNPRRTKSAPLDRDDAEQQLSLHRRRVRAPGPR
jgi:hypothetical protein